MQEAAADIVKAFYEIISGPAGMPRQWARDRTLYIQGVRFVSTGVSNGKIVARVMDHQTFVDRVNDDFVSQGFFEHEIHRVTKTFGNITHVFSAYESRQTLRLGFFSAHDRRPRFSSLRAQAERKVVLVLDQPGIEKRRWSDIVWPSMISSGL